MLGRMVIILAVLIVLLGGTAAGFYFFAAKLPSAATDWVPPSLRPALHLPDKTKKAEAKEAKPAAPEVPAFYDLPDVLAEMPVPNAGNRLIRLAVSLKLRSLADVPPIQDALPKIKDSFQSYLRDTAIGELEKPDQLEHFRQTMLTRLQQVAAPARIDDLLIREVQIQ